MLNNLYIYDIATNAWTSGAPMPVGASYPGSAVVAGKLWVIGGGDPLQQVSLDNTQIYDPGTNSWSNGPTLNTARLFANAVTLNVVGGQMPMIVGGYNRTSGTSCRARSPLSRMCNANSHRNADSHTYRNRNRNTHSDGNGNAYGFANTFTNSNRDGYAIGYTLSNA